MTEQEYRLSVRRTMVCGALLRVLLLVLLLTLLRTVAEPYLMADDAAYEALAAKYLALRTRAIDPQALALSGATGYLEPFWPVAVCVLAGLTGTVTAARWLNVLLSVATVGVLTALVRQTTNSQAAAMRACRLMAYLPVTVITALFPIKDIYLMLSFFTVLLLLVRLSHGERIRVPALLAGVLLTWGCFYTRRLVGVVLVALAFSFLLRRLICRRCTVAAVLLLVAGGVLLWCTREAITSEIAQKLQVYGADTGGQGIALLRIRSLRDVWRLPLACVYGMLQPIRLPLLSSSGMTPYWDVLSLLNLSMLPVATAAALYALCKKHDRLLWLGCALTYAAVIVLSLGIFRHYLFLLPLHVMSAVAYGARTGKGGALPVALGSAGLMLAIALYSFL